MRGEERREAEVHSWALGYLLIDWALIPALLTASLRDGHASVSASLQQATCPAFISRLLPTPNLMSLEEPREIPYGFFSPEWK